MFWGFGEGQELSEPLLYSRVGLTGTYSGRVSLDKLDEALDYVPMPEAMLALKASFSNRVHPVHPVVDLKTPSGDFFMFWEWHVNMNPPPQHLKIDPTFLCLFFGVMFAGAMVMSTSMWESEPGLKGLDRNRMIDDFRLGSVKSLSAWNTHQHPTINALVASILLQHFTLRCPHADAAFVATIVRQAQCIGLHREFEGTLDSYSPLLRVYPLGSGDTLHGAELPNSFRYNATPAKYRSKPYSGQRQPEQSLVLLLAIAQYGAAGLQNRLIQQFGGYSLSQKKVDELKNATVEAAALIDRLDAMVWRWNPDDIDLEYAQPLDRPMDNFVNFEERHELFSSLFGNWVKTMFRMLKMESEISLQKGVVQFSKSEGSSSPDPAKSAALLSTCCSYLKLYLDARKRTTFKPFDWFFLRQPVPQMSVMLILQSLRNDPKAENVQEMLHVVDEFLDIRFRFLSEHNTLWLTSSAVVLGQLRTKLEFPWSREDSDQSRPVYVPDKHVKGVKLSSAKAPTTEGHDEENLEDVEDNIGYDWDIKDLFSLDV